MIRFRRAATGLSLLAAAALLAAGCSSSGSSSSAGGNTAAAARSSGVKILVLYPFLGDQSYVRERLGSLYEAKKYPNLSFTVEAGPTRTGVTFFQDEVNKAVTEGYKVLAINTGATAAELVPLINQATAQGLKVVSFDGTAPAALHITSDVNYSNFAAAQVAGREFKKLLPGGGQIGIIQCEAGLPDTDAFIDGFKAAIQGSNLDVVQQEDAHCDPDQAKTIAENMLTSHPKLVGIYDSLDVSAQGTLQALQADNSKAILGSIGGQEYSLAAIATGTSNWKFTVPYPFEQVGAKAVDVAAAIAEGHTVQPKYLLPVQPIATAANATQVLDKIKQMIAAGE
jgi:ribose transport system substrate-binding protein